MITKGVWNSQYGDFTLKYYDCNDFSDLPIIKIRNVVAVCFYQNKLVIAHNVKGHWGLVGGRVEDGEYYEDTLKREVKEESNMKVIKYKPVGYQVAETSDGEIYQLRYACLVEPYGRFISDPDEGIDKIELIKPIDVKDYFDWGEIGDRIIERALELKENL